MIKRPLRAHFGHDDEKRLLEALRDARDYATRCGGAADFGSKRAERCSAVRASIDALAEELTGDATLFHAKPHG